MIGPSVSRLKKRWTDTVKECLRKRGMDVRQARRMVGVWDGECIGYRKGNEPLILMKCHRCGLSQLYEAFKWKSVCG